MSRLDAATAATIAELPRIVAFRNVLMHGYASVDNRIVWGVNQSSLDPLRAAIDRQLAQGWHQSTLRFPVLFDF